MPETEMLSMLEELPADATNADALVWVETQRRLLDRWETLPGHEKRSMIPELDIRIRRHLHNVESLVRDNMAVS